VRVSDVGTRSIRWKIFARRDTWTAPAVLVIVFRQPGANIIQTVDRIRAALPQLESAIPRAINLTVAMDQTVTIRASVSDVERTLVISVILVILVVFFFCGTSGRLSFRASRAGLAGRTFGVMYLLATASTICP